MDEGGSATNMRPWLVRSTENDTQGSWRKVRLRLRLRLTLLPATCDLLPPLDEPLSYPNGQDGERQGNSPLLHEDTGASNM